MATRHTLERVADMNDEKKDAELQTIGEGAYRSIADMVARYEAAETLANARSFDIDDSEHVDAFRRLRKLDGDMCEEFRRELTTALDNRAETCSTRRECWDAVASGLDFDTAREDAERAIQEDPLSLQYRSGWYTPGSEESLDPEEFEVLLATGGPAVRIIGEFGERGSIDSARLQAQDWFTPWTNYRASEAGATLRRYCEILGVGAEL